MSSRALHERRLRSELDAAPRPPRGAGAGEGDGEDTDTPPALPLGRPALAGALGLPEALLPPRAARAAERLLRRADIAAGPLDLLLASALVCLAAALAAAGAGLDRHLGGAPALAAAALVGAAAPTLLLRALAARRARRIDDALADAIDLMTASLRSGFPLQEALAVSAGELRGPLARELSELLARVRLGEPFPAALAAFADGSGADGARLFARALAIKWEVGGELADTLSKIGGVLRERVRLARQVRTLTAQGRLTALILYAVPYAIGYATWRISPGPMEALLVHPTGGLLVKGALALQVVGFFWIRALVRFGGGS